MSPKPINKFNIIEELSLKTKRIQKLILFTVGFLGKAVLFRKTVHVHGREVFDKFLLNRPSDQGLITCSNHASTVDDNILWSSLLSMKQLSNGARMRWTMAAADICFNVNPLMDHFFASGKCCPVWRNVRDRVTGDLIKEGLGVFQPSMDFLIRKLNEGEWIHVFPQGRVIDEEEFPNENNIRFKWGVGRLINDCSKEPILLPIWHCGFEKVSPVKEPYAKHIFLNSFHRGNISIFIDKPLPLGDILAEIRSIPGISPLEIRRKITDYIQNHMYNLRERAMKFHEENSSSSRRPSIT